MRRQVHDASHMGGEVLRGHLHGCQGRQCRKPACLDTAPLLSEPCRQETSVTLRTKGMLSMRPRFGGTGSKTPSLPCRLRPKPARSRRSPLRLRTA